MKTIYSIEWHLECLENSLSYEEDIALKIASLQEKLDEIHEDNEFRKHQLKEAKKRGKKTFTEKFALNSYLKAKCK